MAANVLVYSSDEHDKYQLIINTFWSRVKITNDCWLWQGSFDQHKYARFWWPPQKKFMPAYRVSYRLIVDTIAKEADLHHICGNPSCVNPEHLVPVSRSEHVTIHHAAQLTHCIHGHRYSPESIYFNTHGWLCCRICCNEQERTRWAKRRGVKVGYARSGETK